MVINYHFKKRDLLSELRAQFPDLDLTIGKSGNDIVISCSKFLQESDIKKILKILNNPWTFVPPKDSRLNTKSFRQELVSFRRERILKAQALNSLNDKLAKRGK